MGQILVEWVSLIPHRHNNNSIKLTSKQILRSCVKDIVNNPVIFLASNVIPLHDRVQSPTKPDMLGARGYRHLLRLIFITFLLKFNISLNKFNQL